MNHFKHASALLALIALPLIAAACKDKTPPPPLPPESAVPAPLPSPADAASPGSFRVRFATTKGDFTVEVTRAWAPKGADRFYRLVNEGYFKDVRFFRVLPGFMAQFGMSGNPALNAKLDSLRITDDPVTQSNKRGMLTFATSGPNSRSHQFFINYGDNASLDVQGFSPFGKVTPSVLALCRDRSELTGNFYSVSRRLATKLVMRQLKLSDLPSVFVQILSSIERLECVRRQVPYCSNPSGPSGKG
jgi:peptidyl-prolyl cis-trans isomerase A (cyclophilin A)